MRHYTDIAAIYERPAGTQPAKPHKTRTAPEVLAPQMAERDILKAILDYLAARKILAWRQNCGAIPATYKGRQRFIRYGQPGQADICGILSPSGRYLAIEVKSAKGKVSDLQALHLELVRSQGGVAGVCRSVEDVAELLREAGVT